MYYESANDVQLRLRHSVVRFENQPVVVEEVGGKEVVGVTNILTGERFTASVKKLDLTPVPLGYMSAGKSLFYVMRKPTRKYKQGLCGENVMFKLVSGENIPVSYCGKHIGNTIVGNYPDIGAAFSQVRNGKAKAVPFSREWAVAEREDELCILYRGETVGFVGDTFVSILPERAYLKESLELCLK